MQAVLDYKYFGLAAVAVLLCGLLFIIWRWPQGKHKTFSQHVAVARHTILYYIALFSIVLPLLLLFFIGWFTPSFRLPLWFNVSITISSLMQYACTLVPEVGGWKTRCHRLLAGVSALCLLPPMVFLLVSSFVESIGKVLVSLGGLVMFAVAYAVIKNKGTPPYFLLLQAAYYAAFFVPVLYIAYLQ